MVIAWLLSNWLLSQARNISHYGIEPRKVGSLAGGQEASADPATVAFQQVQRELREEMQTLTDDLGKCRDPFLSSRIEQRMRRLMDHIVPEENEVVNVDQMIAQAKEGRRSERSQNNSRQVGGQNVGWNPWGRAA